MVMPAFASGMQIPFQDVPVNSPYAEGVRYVYEEGIANGTGFGMFSPNRPITLGEFSVMAGRALFDERWSFETAVDQIANKQAGLGLNPEMAKNSTVARAVAYQLLFACLDIPAFGDELYSEKTAADGVSNEYLYTAINMGLCDDDADPMEEITRGEIAQLLYEIKTTPLERMPLPDIVRELNIEIEEDYLSNSGAYLKKAIMVPHEIRDRFVAEGWKFVIGNDYISEWNQENQTIVIGLTDYVNKTIYACNPGSVIHEFGHFLHKQLGWPAEITDLFTEESDGASIVLRAYALTNEKEYFAEFFSKWIGATEFNGEDSKLKDLTPGTWAYFNSLQDENWISGAKN